MKSVNTSAPLAGDRGSIPRSLDDTRPFGAHIRMAWWKSLILVVAVPLTLVVVQLGLYLLAGLFEGGDPLAPTLTPLKLLAANLSTGLTALLALVLVSRFAKVPWRSVFSSPRRFDRRRLAIYLVGSIVLVAASVGVVAVVAPDAAGWVGLGVTGTTVALLAVTVLTTPIQAAGEEIVFRGAILPAAASWFRAARPAFLTGVVVQAILFAVVHGAGDPWLNGYYVFFSVCTALMGLITRGLEAAIAFHIGNNLVTTTVNVLMADGNTLGVDRAAGTAGPAMIILAVLNLSVLTFVWLRERALRTRSERSPAAGVGPGAAG